MSNDLVKRLRATTYGATVNPDGLEAIDRIEQLEAALRFYKDGNNYEAQKVWTTTFPQYEPDGYRMVTPVLSDKGSRARAALGEKKSD